jgi:hypothetical protein
MGVPLGAAPVLPVLAPAAVPAVLPALVARGELLDLDELLQAAATSTSPNKATIHTLRIRMAPPSAVLRLDRMDKSVVNNCSLCKTLMPVFLVFFSSSTGVTQPALR